MPLRFRTLDVTLILGAAVALGTTGCSGGGGGGTPIQPGPSPTLAFGAPITVATGGAGGRSAVVADVHADGLADVLIANETLSTISVLRGQPDGSFAMGPVLPAPLTVGALVVADVNGDQIVDVVAASSVANDAGAAVGRGDGSFNLPAAIAMPWPTAKIDAVDWNRDGITDLVASAATTTELAVLPGLGAGAFGAPVTLSIGYIAADFAIADVNRDSLPDLVATGAGGLGIDVFRNDGAGGLLPPATTATDARGGRLVCCDLDGDRLPDVVAVDASLESVTVFRGAGNSSFSVGPQIGVGAIVESLALGDLDGDGELDLVIAAGTGVHAAYGDGSGAFGGVETIRAGAAAPSSVVAADLTGSGFVDVLYLESGNQLARLANPRSRTVVGLDGFGIGTPDCAGPIGMWAKGGPQVGDAEFYYYATNAPADSIGWFLQGGPRNEAGIPFAGVLVHVDLNPILATRFVTSDQIGSAVVVDAVPNNAGLAGLEIHTQTLWLADAATTCSTSPGAIVSSRGLTVTIQP